MKAIKMLIFTSVLLLTACGSIQNSEKPSQQNSTSLLYTLAAQTAEASKLTANTPVASPQPTEETPVVPTSTAAFAVQAPIAADLVNLRSGPGTFFSALGTIYRGVEVTATGMLADGSWIKVYAPQTDGSSVEGWVFASLLDLSSLESSLPILQWPVKNTISGTITDQQGNPINAVRVAASTVNEGKDLRAEGNSNRSGEFFIYAPIELAGPFTLEIVAVNCSSSISKIKADGSCMVTDYFPVSWRTSISLPQQNPVRFIYERGVAFLEGKVVYQDGNGASQILVRATRRSDGVESEFVTPVGGAFRLPLGLGTWDLVAVRFLSDGTPLTSESRVLEITSSGQVIEPLLISYTEIIER